MFAIMFTIFAIENATFYILFAAGKPATVLQRIRVVYMTNITSSEKQNAETKTHTSERSQLVKLMRQ